MPGGLRADSHRVKREARAYIKAEAAIGIDMAEQQRRQSAPVRFRQATHPILVLQHPLNHQRIDVYQADLQQMQREHADFLFIQRIYTGNGAEWSQADRTSAKGLCGGHDPPRCEAYVRNAFCAPRRTNAARARDPGLADEVPDAPRRSSGKPNLIILLKQVRRFDLESDNVTER